VALLLLDLDNTVADRVAAFEHWMAYKLAAWAPTDPSARSFLIREDEDGFRPRRDFLATAADRFQLDESGDALLSEYGRLTLCGFPPMSDEVRERLTSMRRVGWKVGLVTNGESGVQEATARRIGLMALLDACVVSGAVGVRKPDPQLLALAAEHCGEPLDGAWMVGDGDVDVLGAAHAGINSIWLTRGRAWSRTDVRPTAMADTLTEALERLAHAGHERRRQTRSDG